MPTATTADTGAPVPTGGSGGSGTAHSGTASTHTGTPTTHTGTPPTPVDYAATGPHAAVRSEVTARDTSCRGGMRVIRFDPDGSPPSAVVVVAHGFSGSPGQVVGWGEHWASWGLTVLVPDLCHSLPWNVDHEQNGLDMVALAAELAPGLPPAYAGHSAGGLAALVAAATDAGAAAHLGLDAVDAFGIAGRTIGDLAAPAAQLYAEPSACNASNNMLAIYDAAGVPTVRVVGSDHCDWLRPADPSCALVCATGPRDPQIAPTIDRMSTAFLLWRTGLDVSAATWWTPGEAGWDDLVASGAIVP
ncbi:MAG: hypothetical protein H6735_23640 [Alphaproteobacteria bacterium]|nr:hypothetical protein [Alphaproteobacteria bacterium]